MRSGQNRSDPIHEHAPRGPHRHRGLRAAATVVATLALVLVPALPAVARDASASRAAAPTAVAATSTQPTLRQGARGAAVLRLQKRLAALRYDVGPADGVFGPSTYHGVVAFQKVQRIAIDGIVGPQTWGRLAKPVVPEPRYTRSTAAVEIDLRLRVVLVTKAGVVTRVLDASPGKPSTPTVTGSFTIYRRIDGWRTSPLGRLWRPNYFYRGYALHGATSVPTYAASHGCVRVTVPAMNRLWSQLFVGEHVNVYR